MPMNLFRVVNPALEVSACCLRFVDSAGEGRHLRCTMQFVSWNHSFGSQFVCLKSRSDSRMCWRSGANPDNAGDLAVSSEEKVHNVVLKQAALINEQLRLRGDLEVKPKIVFPGSHRALSVAYDHCHEICAENAKTFYLVWCRRTDELVDGPNASYITPAALDSWEARLEDIFQDGPFDMFDAALSDTVTKFPVNIQVDSVAR